MAAKNSILISVLILILIQCLFLAGCEELVGWVQEPGCRYPDGAKGYHEIREISEVGNRAKIQQLKDFSIPEQIQIYLYSKQCIGEGGDPRIGAYFSLDGEKKIPLVMEQMKKVGSALEKAYLLDALFDINDNCHCIKKTSSTFNDIITISQGIKQVLGPQKTTRSYSI